ncbi:hypothetical protein MRX96_036621 [Rhipicephalus microplus]
MHPVWPAWQACLRSINELLNHGVAPPNIAIQHSYHLSQGQGRDLQEKMMKMFRPRGGISGADAPQQLSPRFGGVLSPPSATETYIFKCISHQWTNRQSDVAFNPSSVGRHRTVVPRARRRPQQLSPGQRYSPQQPQQPGGGFPSPYTSPGSPHLGSPSGGNGPPQWSPRPQAASLQQQNPMLNAQLSQGGLRQVVSPGASLARNQSPFGEQFPFAPATRGGPSPGPPPPQQGRLQRAMSVPAGARVNSPRTPQQQPQPQPGFGNDQLLSPPGPQMSPGGAYGAAPASSAPVFGLDASPQFNFEQHSLHGFASDRSRVGGSMPSEYVRQELRAIVGARTQGQVDDKPSSDQRKSLLQQLLSEPT